MFPTYWMLCHDSSVHTYPHLGPEYTAISYVNEA